MPLPDAKINIVLSFIYEKENFMTEQTKCNFLRKRMSELRKANNKSLSDMAELIGCDKSALSRAEKIDGTTKYKTIRDFAEEYCDKLGLTPEQKKLFMRGEKIVVIDTSAVLKNPQLIDELCMEYNRVIVPDVVINELDRIKDHNKRHSAKAWQILRSISSNNNIIKLICAKDVKGNNDCRIIAVAQQAAEEFGCCVDIITDDIGFAARLKGNETVAALFLGEYMTARQNIIDVEALKKIADYYADSYDNIQDVLKISMPYEKLLNAYLADGNTLIISAVRNKKPPISQRKEKIRWLTAHGADVNGRDNGKYYFPPLTHAVQCNDFEMFKFLLNECHANPNVGSRNPHNSGKIRQKNDGNMPLMVAAWDNRINFVKELLKDERTSINQQDGNGFTALIKACYWGHTQCRDMLLKAGADTKITDRNGLTADDHYKECAKLGRRKGDRR